MLDEIKHFFTDIKNDFKASVNQLKNIKNETQMRLNEEISSSIDNLLETVKNEALANEDIQLVIKLIIVAIIIHLIFSTIVLIYIAVSCYVMIYKQKVFNKDYIPPNQSKPYLKDMEISDQFLRKDKE
uniref:Uncharacterized protein n=1 Tax=Panagrolaimus sp. PS1159 TaxID=55785 RepID=A0AC35F1I9_9BILA